MPRKIKKANQNIKTISLQPLDSSTLPVPDIPIDNPLKYPANQFLDKNPVSDSKINYRLFYYWLILSVFIIILSLSIYLYSLKTNSSAKSKSPQVFQSDAQIVSPIPTLDKSQVRLIILNGSGIPKEASKIATKLTELGYLNLKTGNADRSNYVNSQIYLTPDLKNYTDYLLTDIHKVLPLASISGEFINQSSYSAQIIIGK